MRWFGIWRLLGGMPCVGGMPGLRVAVSLLGFVVFNDTCDGHASYHAVHSKFIAGTSAKKSAELS